MQEIWLKWLPVDRTQCEHSAASVATNWSGRMVPTPSRKTVVGREGGFPVQVSTMLAKGELVRTRLHEVGMTCAATLVVLIISHAFSEFQDQESVANVCTPSHAEIEADKMTKLETRPTIGPGKRPEHDELSRLLGDISDVLEELADAEADAAYRIPCAPCGPLSEGLAMLLYRLRLNFFVDPGDCLQEELLTADPSFADNVSRIRSKRHILNTALDDILELAICSGHPGTSWMEIEARFRYFANRVTEHAAISDGMRRESVSDRATTPK